MLFRQVPFRAFVVTGTLLLATLPAHAQNLLDFFKNGQANPFAPVDNGNGAVPPNLTINPTSPGRGDVPAPAEQKEDEKPVSAVPKEAAKTGRDKKARELSPREKKAAEAKAKAEAAKAEAAQAKKEAAEEEEDEDALFEYEEPRRVTVVLPVPRPGVRIRSAAEVAPVGTARWSAGKEQLPPGVNFRETVAAPVSPALPGTTRVAALPQTQTVPRWTSSDIQPLRPTGLREVETPVANMPGVYAPPEANFQCLPMGVKQVLVDTAKRFGHVAILNAKRPRGTGARASYHYQCRAVDFRVRGVPVRTVYNFLKDHPNVGGRKIYPMGFFHIDDGPIRSW